MMIGQEVTTQAFGSLPRRQSAGRGLEEAANAGGTTLQSKHHWKESAFQPLQFGADGTVGQGGPLIHVEDSKCGQVFGQPSLVVFSVARLRNPISVFTQDNDRNGDLSGLAKDRFERRFPLCHS